MNKETAERFIARDIIDMAREDTSDTDTLESLSGICFNLARLHGAAVVDWDILFSILDQAYSNNDKKLLEQLDPVYRKITLLIEE